MSSIKISQLPQLPNISSNTSNTLFVGVDLPSGITGRFTATTLSQQLYANNQLVVGNNLIVFPNTIGQLSGYDPMYLQLNMQNFNPTGSGDYIVTNDIGTNSNNYIDLGINNSLFNGDGQYSSMRRNDGYLYVHGSTDTSYDGNLIIGTSSTGANVIVVVGNTTAQNIVAVFTKSGLSLNTQSAITFADGSQQNTAAAPLAYSQAAFASGNSQITLQSAINLTQNTLIGLVWNQANNTLGVDATQNTITSLVWNQANNTLGVDATQNTNIQLAWNEANTSLQNTTTITANTNLVVPNLITATTLNVANINTTSTVNVGGPILFGSGSISAGGSSNTTATLVVADNTYVLGGVGGVILPAAVVGREISITNSNAYSITVYPGSGASIELLSANQGVTLPPYATLAVVAKSTTNWWATTYIFTAGSNISLTQGGSGSITINSTDTLSSVVARGNTTTSNVTMNVITANTIYTPNTTINNGIVTTANLQANVVISNTFICGNTTISSSVIVSDGGVFQYTTSNNTTVTQTGSRNNPVTANGRTGQITTVAAALNTGYATTFTVNNNQIVSSSDVVIVNIASGDSSGNTYTVSTTGVTPGSFKITIANCGHTNSPTDTLVLNFAIIRVQ